MDCITLLKDAHKTNRSLLTLKLLVNQAENLSSQTEVLFTNQHCRCMKTNTFLRFKTSCHNLLYELGFLFNILIKVKHSIEDFLKGCSIRTLNLCTIPLSFLFNVINQSHTMSPSLACSKYDVQCTYTPNLCSQYRQDTNRQILQVPHQNSSSKFPQCRPKEIL